MAFVAAVMAGGAWSSAAIEYSTPGAVHSEDFDTLANTDTPAWQNNSTLPGWYVFNSTATSGATGIVRTAPDNVAPGSWSSPVTYVTDPASIASSTIHSFGSAGATDRALGSIAGSTGSAAAGDMMYGLVLRNTTGQTLTSFTVSYTGEQWREAKVRNPGDPIQPADKLGFDYLLTPTFSNTTIPTQNGFGDYTQVPEMDFFSPSTGNTATDYVVLDGNAADNRQALQQTIDVNWADGSYLVLRFWDNDDAGFDHAVGIDDLSFSANASAVPEPIGGSMLLLGASLLGLRRRRQQ